MKLKRGNTSGRAKRPGSSIVLYIASIVIGLIALYLLYINITSFYQAVDQYVAQGYPAAEVLGQLVPSQLLPSIFQPIGLYGGIALALFGVGKVISKVSICGTAVDEERTEDVAVDSVNTGAVIETETDVKTEDNGSK